MLFCKSGEKEGYKDKKYVQHYGDKYIHCQQLCFCYLFIYLLEKVTLNPRSINVQGLNIGLVS